MESKAKKIASIMSTISIQTIWPFVKEMAEESGHKVNYPFKSQVGSGKKTYHQKKLVNNKTHHVVVYGQKMIIDKFNKNNAERWLTAREIRKYNFCKGDVTLENLLIHTMLHEMAHVIQNIAGDRLYGSVHNNEFYQWLKKMHVKCGEIVKKEFQEKIEEQKISLEFVGASEKEEMIKDIRSVVISGIYKCNLKGNDVLVRVLKKNKKTLSVIVIKGKETLIGGEWRAPFQLLQKATPEEIKGFDSGKTPVKKPVKNLSQKGSLLGMADIILGQEYNMLLKGKTVIVRPLKKNRKTVSVVIEKGDKNRVGQRGTVSPTYLLNI